MKNAKSKVQGGRMWRAAREEGFKEKRVLANVTVEGVGGPSPGSLDEHWCSAAFS